MSTFTQWISAFRLRTLFLAIAAVVLGSAMSWREGSFSITIFLIALLLAVAIQILANLANDLGDFQKGTDITGKRQGPTRALQSGKITQKEMKRAVVLFVILCVITGLALIWSATPFRDRLHCLDNGCSWCRMHLGSSLLYNGENMLMATEVLVICLRFSSSGLFSHWYMNFILILLTGNRCYRQ